MSTGLSTGLRSSVSGSRQLPFYPVMSKYRIEFCSFRYPCAAGVRHIHRRPSNGNCSRTSGETHSGPVRPARRTLRGWFNATSLQDVGNRASRQVVSEVRQCTDNARVSPVAVLDGHFHHQRFDFVSRAGSTGTAAGAPIALPSDQLSVPGEQSLRRNDGCELRQSAPFEALRSRRGRWSSVKRSRRPPSCSRRTRFSSRR